MKPNMPSAQKQTFKYLSLCKITQGRFNLHLTKLTKIYKQGQLERVFLSEQLPENYKSNNHQNLRTANHVIENPGNSGKKYQLEQGFLMTSSREIGLTPDTCAPGRQTRFLRFLHRVLRFLIARSHGMNFRKCISDRSHVNIYQIMALILRQSKCTCKCTEWP